DQVDTFLGYLEWTVATLHAGVVRISSPATVGISYGNDGQSFQNLAHCNDAAVSERIDLALFLVVVAETTAHLKPFFDLAIHYKSRGISFHPGFLHQAVLVSISEVDSIAIILISSGKIQLVILGESLL